jgi:hypothetical protein
MLHHRRRVGGTAIRRLTSLPEEAFIEYAVSSASEQRHGGQAGGPLATAVNIVVSAYLRSLNVGRRVRITLWEAPTARHIEIATAAALAHGFTLVPGEGEAKVFVVEKSLAEATCDAESEVIHLLAS